MSFKDIRADRLGALRLEKKDEWFGYRTVIWCHLLNEPFLAKGMVCQVCPVCESDLSDYHPGEGTHEAIGYVVPPWQLA